MNLDFFQLELTENILESNQIYLQLVCKEYVSLNESDLDLQKQLEIQEGFIDSAKEIILKILKSIGDFFKNIIDMIKSFFKGSDKIGDDENKENIEKAYKEIQELKLKSLNDMPSFNIDTKLNLNTSMDDNTSNLVKAIDKTFTNVNDDIIKLVQDDNYDNISGIYGDGESSKIQEVICKYFEDSLGKSFKSKTFSDLSKSLEKYCDSLNLDMNNIEIGIDEVEKVFSIRNKLSKQRDSIIKSADMVLKKIISVEDVIDEYSEKQKDSEKIVKLAKGIISSLGTFVSSDITIVYKTYLNTIKVCDSIIISYKKKAKEYIKNKEKGISNETGYLDVYSIEDLIEESVEKEYKLQLIREEKQFMYYIQEGYLNQLVMGPKVRRYNKKNNVKIEGIDDLIKHGYNPGVRELIKNCNSIEDLNYIRKDNSLVKPTIVKIRDRIIECKKLKPDDEVPNYYKHIKSHYIDKGITEKDCDKTLKEIKNTNQMISDRIKELKKKQSTKESTTFIESVMNSSLLIEEMKRSELPDEVFGIPSQRKYPMPDKKHVYSAIKLFGHVDEEHEKELARNIKKMMKKYDISPDEVGDKNKLKEYLNESYRESDNFIIINENIEHAVDRLNIPKDVKDFANKMYKDFKGDYKRDYKRNITKSFAQQVSSASKSSYNIHVKYIVKYVSKNGGKVISISSYDVYTYGVYTYTNHIVIIDYKTYLISMTMKGDKVGVISSRTPLGINCFYDSKKSDIDKKVLTDFICIFKGKVESVTITDNKITIKIVGSVSNNMAEAIRNYLLSNHPDYVLDKKGLLGDKLVFKKVRMNK